MKIKLCRASGMLAIVFLATAWAVAGEQGRSVFVLTSTNNASANGVVVFELNTTGTPSLSYVDTLTTGGKGCALGPQAGILQFKDNRGAVANCGSNSVTELVREDDSISIGQTINLTNSCVTPDSVALGKKHLYVVGTNCAQSYWWPSGSVDGTVTLTDPTAAQIAVGWSWAAVTLADPTATGSVLQLWLTPDGALNGTSTDITLPANTNSVPLGEEFWGDILGFTPAHSSNSFAILNKAGTVSPIAGPTPAGPPNNAPCWVAKGAGNIWYTANSPAGAISIFFSDSQGGVYYKSITLPVGMLPTDIAVSRDGKWLAVIYTYSGEGYIDVYSIDSYGDLTFAATSPSEGVPSYTGVAFSE